MPIFRTSPAFAKLLLPLAGFALAAALAVPAIYWAESSNLAAWSRKAERFVPGKKGREVVHLPGVATPPAVSAAEAPLGPDEPVVGVEAGGKFRAYHLASMKPKANHVVNDLVGGRAVTVTYCDLDDCVAAYGGAESTTPLAIALEGLADGGMLISADGVAYFQKTAEAADIPPEGPPPRFPYPSFPTTRTTWGRWKSEHPDTDLYLYQPAMPAPAASSSGEAGR